MDAEVVVMTSTGDLAARGVREARVESDEADSFPTM